MTVVIYSALGAFLFAVGVYLLLARSVARMVLGLVFLGYAATLLLFVAGGTVRGAFCTNPLP